MRAKLAAVLPRAPGIEGQVIKEPAIFHTTVARLLSPLHLNVRASGSDKVLESQQASRLLAVTVSQLSADLCGMRADFAELWFVEEKDVLALGLNGKYDVQRMPLACV